MAISEESTLELDIKKEEPSPTNPSFQQHTSGCDLAKSLIGAAAGNFLEWFDFAIFGLFAQEIGENFFPPSSGNTVKLLESFAVFAGAFFMRPLGGALFGYIGDKYSRLTALRLSIFMMAIPTFLTGCLPTYHDIGIFSTILLVLLRLIQGLSVGGEITGALVYILEICPQNRRALFATLVQVSGSGTLLGSLFAAVLRGIFTDEQMSKYAWRFPFFFGLIVSCFGLWMRKSLKESKLHEYHKKNAGTIKNPIILTFQNHKKKLIYIVFHIAFAAQSYYTIFIWFPSYLLDLRTPAFEKAFTLNMVSLLISLVFQIFGSLLTDKYTPTKILLIFGTIYILFIAIVVPLLEVINDTGVIITHISLGVLFGIYSSAVSVWALDILTDTITRYTTLGIGYNIALALCGGTAPFVATAVVSRFNISAYAWVLFSIGMISITTDGYVGCVVNKNIATNKKHNFKTENNNNNNVYNSTAQMSPVSAQHNSQYTYNMDPVI